MDKIVPISDLQTSAKQILELVKRTGDAVVITQRGRPAAMLVSFDEYEGLLATVAEMSEPGWRDRLAEAERDSAAGRGVDLESWKEKRRRATRKKD